MLVIHEWQDALGNTDENQGKINAVFVIESNRKHMKKYLLLFWVAMTSIYALAADYHSLEEIRDQWMSHTIKVPQGGKNPGIVQLVKAFQDTWRRNRVPSNPL